jgi:hypothetical protein
VTLTTSVILLGLILEDHDLFLFSGLFSDSDDLYGRRGFTDELLAFVAYEHGVKGNFLTVFHAELST